jgi:hypothetical protein
MVAVPFVLDGASSVGRLFAWASAFSSLTLAAWIAGLFAASVRILCRLF